MSFEEFPEIDAFHKLPRRVIVKGGISGLAKDGHAELSGIVINNHGQPIKDLKVNLVVFDPRDIPMASYTAVPDPPRLSQGGMASFKFVLEGTKEKIDRYYLYPTWQYDDSEWS
jgi:hypothetical protein